MAEQAPTRPIGVWWEGGHAFARVWAPGRARVAVVVEGATPRVIPLAADPPDHFAGPLTEVSPGDRYRIQVDDDTPWPDPASRSQPDGVHGSSEIVDPRRYRWGDAEWHPPRFDELVIYELHVGTFSADGTFRGVIAHLPALRDLGVSAIELMPVAAFAGEHNWGYDGAALFAPAEQYGTADDLRALVDAAHQAGIAMILDVVYNHIGPDGAYICCVTDALFSATHHTPWGAGLNFDGPSSRGVRDFFLANASEWLVEYHFDGLRFDATQTIADDSSPHILAELVGHLRAVAGQQVYLIAEDNRNFLDLVRPPLLGGFGFDAIWADDFHHQLRRMLAGDQQGYFASYSADVADLVTIIRRGWLVHRSQDNTAVRVAADVPGTPDPAIPPSSFIFCLQNHDQVGNRPLGERLGADISPPAFRAASALLFLLPQVPLLFMGQEWHASTPFQFFTAHHGELGRQITAGRRDEVCANHGPEITPDSVPDPQDPASFRRSRLDWDERDHEDGNHAATLRLYRALIALRQTWLRQMRAAGWDFDCRSLDDDTIALHYVAPSCELLVLVRLRGAGTVQHDDHAGDADNWHLIFSTEDPPFTASGEPTAIRAGRCTFQQPGAVVLTRRPPCVVGQSTTSPAA